MTAFGLWIKMFPLYCSKGSQWAAALSAVTPPPMNCSECTQFPSDCVFVFVNDFSFTPLCSVSTTEHNGVKEKSFTKKKTQSLWKLTECIQENRSSANQDRSPLEWLPILQYKGNLQSTTAPVNTSCFHVLVASTLAYYSKELRFKPNCLHQ